MSVNPTDLRWLPIFSLYHKQYKSDISVWKVCIFVSLLKSLALHCLASSSQPKHNFLGNKACGWQHIYDYLSLNSNILSRLSVPPRVNGQPHCGTFDTVMAEGKYVQLSPPPIPDIIAAIPALISWPLTQCHYVLCPRLCGRLDANLNAAHAQLYVLIMFSKT